MAAKKPQFGPGDPLLVAKESGTIRVGDADFIIAKGETQLRSGHPLPKARPELFELAEEEEGQ